MSDKPRYVFDVNAIVSALLFENSVPGRAFAAATERGDILISRPVIEELENVLLRPKFDRYLDRDDRDQFLYAFVQAGTLIEIDEEIRACRDPRDDKLLELAVCGKADCLITGDEDLLVLNPFRSIPVMTPAEFLASIPDEQADTD